METLLFFMSGLTLGIALTYTYYDSKEREEKFNALLAKVKLGNNHDNNHDNDNYNGKYF